MKENIRIARELVRLAKELAAVSVPMPKNVFRDTFSQAVQNKPQAVNKLYDTFKQPKTGGSGGDDLGEENLDI